MPKAARIVVLAVAICLMAGSVMAREAFSPAIGGFYLGQTTDQVIEKCKEERLKIEYSSVCDFGYFYTLKDEFNQVQFSLMFQARIEEENSEVIAINFTGHAFNNEESRLSRSSIKYYIFISEIQQIKKCYIYEENKKTGSYTYILNPKEDWEIQLEFKKNGDIEDGYMTRISCDPYASFFDISLPSGR